MTRIERIRKTFYYKENITKEFRGGGEFKDSVFAMPEFRPEIKICTERARLLTESYQSTEGDPEIIRKAKAIAHIIDNMTIYILDGELIVGNFAGNPWSLPIYPEMWDFMHTEESDIPFLTPEFGAQLMERAARGGVDLDKLLKRQQVQREVMAKAWNAVENKEEYREICKYWADKSMIARVNGMIGVTPDDFADWLNYSYFNGICWSHFGGIRSPDGGNMKKLFQIGLKGIEEEILERRSRLTQSKGDTTWEEYGEQCETLEAFLISIRAAQRFIKRYADKARETMAASEGEQKRELEKIAQICDWVSVNPPRTLHEAMQLMFSVDLMCKSIEHQGQALGYRFDVLLNPFYQKDREEGRLTREEAKELMECMILKLGEKGQVNPSWAAMFYEGMSDVKDIVIGGVTPEGNDATNDFSFIILEAAEAVKLPEPTVAIRYHEKINPDLIFRAIDVVRAGMGHPIFFNDAAGIPYFLNRGVPLEQARDYGVRACVTADMSDGTHSRPLRPNTGMINFASCLEMALSQGKSKFTGQQLGVITPDPLAFTDIEDVKEAYLTQVRHFLGKLVEIEDMSTFICGRYFPRPLLSCFMNHCPEKAKDCTRWGDPRYSYPNILCSGQTNVADSLAVIKKLVFDEQSVTMEELLDACRNNWEGREYLRQRCINEVPKFGNDDDYVDELARWVHVKTNEENRKFKDRWGAQFVLDGSMAGAYHGASRGCGATPDGRKDGEPTADGVISPMAGRDKKGPTSVLKSVGKIPVTYCHLFNQKFMPQFLEGENKKVFAQYLKTWADLGAWHIQFNVVDQKILLKAQDYPEDYGDLVVRVAGYSAYFVTLAKPLQDDIIRRSEQAFG